MDSIYARVKELATCPICLEIIKSPKSLPCLHAFCLECLRTDCSKLLPGERHGCPLCRQPFTVPASGVDGLANNFTLDSLAEVARNSVPAATATAASAATPTTTCLENNGVIPPAVVVCTDCRQNLCETCARPHTQMPSGSHMLIALGGRERTSMSAVDGAKQPGGETSRRWNEEGFRTSVRTSAESKQAFNYRKLQAKLVETPSGAAAAAKVGLRQQTAAAAATAAVVTAGYRSVLQPAMSANEPLFDNAALDVTNALRSRQQRPFNASTSGSSKLPDLEPTYVNGSQQQQPKKPPLSPHVARHCEELVGTSLSSLLTESSLILWSQREPLWSGQGYEVFAGTLRGTVKVNIKTMTANSMLTPDEFLKEAKTIHQLQQHPKLVQLLGFYRSPAYILTEYMSKGSLRDYLRSDGGSQLTFGTMLSIAAQVADGMSYVELRRFVHCDLRAGNIHVGDGNVAKVANFELARELGVNGKIYLEPGKKFPIKWTASEVFEDGFLTVKCDVWSFGILLYEIVTYGRCPYPGMDNESVQKRVMAGYRMPNPDGSETRHPERPCRCPVYLYKMMTDCWNSRSERRPTFETLKYMLEDYDTWSEEETPHRLIHP